MCLIEAVMKGDLSRVKDRGADINTTNNIINASLFSINMVIIIYLGGIYSSHVSCKEWTQICCIDFNRERSQPKSCQQSKCSCTYVI